MAGRIALSRWSRMLKTLLFLVSLQLVRPSGHPCRETLNRDVCAHLSRTHCQKEQEHVPLTVYCSRLFMQHSAAPQANGPDRALRSHALDPPHSSRRDAHRCTAPTAWAPIPSWTWSFSAVRRRGRGPGDEVYTAWVCPFLL